MATVGACADLAETYGTDLIVLSGGVFQNRMLLERTLALYSRGGAGTADLPL